MKSELLLCSPVAVAIFTLMIIAVLSFIWGTITKRHDDQAGLGHLARFRTLPIMILVSSGCSALFLIFYATAFQQSTFYANPGAASALGSTSSGFRVAPITVAASLFGGALFIAFTVLKYRSHIQAEEKLSLEKTDAKFRTAEHYNERFSKAAEMLGSSQTATRLGGVYALSALADEWVLNRQQCVDLLCGYMRGPISRQNDPASPLSSPQLPSRQIMKRPEMEPDSSLGFGDEYRRPQRAIAANYEKAASRDEVEVRKAILSSIARGTRRSAGDSRSWSGMTFDLSTSFIDSVDFSNCSFNEKVNFNGSIFIGSANMRKARFDANAQFDGCLFLDRTWFSKAVFGGHAWFRAAEFVKEARFGNTRFLGGMIFSYSKFHDVCHFRENTLGTTGSAKEIAYADWTGATLPGGQTACWIVGVSSSIWIDFSHLDSDYTIRCDMGHAHSMDSGRPRMKVSN